MSEIVETVKVKKKGSRLGYHVINKSAFNPSVHELWSDAPSGEIVDEGPGDPALDTMTIDELHSLAVDLGIEPKETWSAKKLIAEITKKRVA